MKVNTPKLCLLFLFSGIFFLSASAQTNLYFQQVTETGLSSTVGRSVVCDKDNIVYFGGNDGLYKFDGYKFTKFPSTGSSKNVCPLVNIRALMYDGEKVWLGGPEGFASYDPEQEVFKTYVSAFNKTMEEKPGVRGFCKLNDDILLAATYRSYTIIHTKTGSLENVKLPESFPETETSFTVKMAQDSKQNVWIATVDDGLYYSSDIYKTPEKAETIFPALKNFPSTKIIEILAYTNDTILVGTTTGLFSLNIHDGNWRLIEMKNAADEHIAPYIKKIVKVNEEGDLFIATLGNGFFHYLAKKKRFQNYVYQPGWVNGLPDNYVNDIAAGKNGIYWIALEDSWLAMINTWLSKYEYVLLPQESDVKSAITITDLEEDGDDYWLTTGDGYMKYDAQKKFIHYGTEYSTYAGEYLQTLSRIDENHFAFIVFGSSIGVFDKRKNTFGYLQPPGKNIMGEKMIFDWLSYVDDEHNYYLVDYNGTYLKCNYQNNTIDTLFTAGEVNLALPVVLPETENTVWILSASRLYYYNLETKELTKITQDKNGNRLPPVTFQEDLVVRKNGMLYIASVDEGFFAYDRNKNILTKYTTENGLSSNICFALFEDRQHRIYILTSNSLASFDERTEKITTYPLPRTVGITQPYVDRQDNLFMGVNSGFIKIPLDSLKTYTGKPEIKILSLKAGNKIFSLDEIEKGISIHHQDFPFEIKYQLIDYFSPGNNKVLYTLHGWDEGWIEDKNQIFSAYYSKVTAGNYVFRVQGRNNMNTEFAELEVPVKVLAPYWQTTWFRALGIISILLIPYLIYRYRLKQIRKIHAIRNNIAFDLHDEVGSSLSSIKMLSEIAVIQEGNKDILHKISNNAKESAEKMQDIIWMINPKNDSTENMLQRMKKFLDEMCRPLGIEYEFINNTSEKFDMQKRKNIMLVFKEAVNNAVKYSGAKKITASLIKDDHTIILRIQDDGKGFDKEAIVPGNGLDSMRMRTEELKGLFSIQSEKNKGTQIMVSIPL